MGRRVINTQSSSSILESATWEIPGTIGSTTPNTGSFTTLAASGAFTATSTTALGSAAQFTVSAAGLPTKCNNITLAGQGHPLIVAITSQKSETGADTNVLTYTPPAAAATYRVTVSWSVQTATSAVIGWTMTWTDSSGVAKSPTNVALSQLGTAAPALTFTAGSGSFYYSDAFIDTDNSGTNIVVKTTMGTGTLTASKLTAVIERLI